MATTMMIAAALVLATASALETKPYTATAPYYRAHAAFDAATNEPLVEYWAGARRLEAEDMCPERIVDSCPTTCFRRKCKRTNRFKTKDKCLANGANTAWCDRVNATAYNESCAAFVNDCGFPHTTGACYEARCEEKLSSESACTSASDDNFWCDDGATSVPTVVPTTAPTASCDDPDSFLPDPVACDQCVLPRLIFGLRVDGVSRRRRLGGRNNIKTQVVDLRQHHRGYLRLRAAASRFTESYGAFTSKSADRSAVRSNAKSNVTARHPGEPPCRRATTRTHE